MASVASPLARAPRASAQSRFPRFAFLDGLPLRVALVVNLLALGQREFAFDASLGGVDPGRDERQALLANLSFQPVDLPAVHQQFAGPPGLRVFVPGKAVGADVDIVQPEFPVLHRGVRVSELDLANPA